MLVWIEDIGIFVCWIYLNIKNLFAKTRKRYYSLNELWQGRSYGLNPDDRPYITIGFITVFSAIFLIFGINWSKHFVASQ